MPRKEVKKLKLHKIMRKKLYREPNEGFVGGVCAGLETHTGIDALVWRLAALFIPGRRIHVSSPVDIN